jgi:hypothetical protein
MEYISFFDGKRWHEFSDDMIALTIFRIGYYASPQGNVRNELDDALTELYGYNAIHDRVNNCKKALMKIKERGKAAFIEDLYDIDIFVPYKSKLPMANLQENLKHGMGNAKNALNVNNNMYASMVVLREFMYGLYYFSLPEDAENFIAITLEKASGKDWKDAADILVKAIEDIVEGNISAVKEAHVNTPAPEKKRGLFASIFG